MLPSSGELKGKAPIGGGSKVYQKAERPVTWMDVLAEKEADFAPVAPVSWTDPGHNDPFQKTSPKGFEF